MRKQIAAANWKMNCTLNEAKELLQSLGNKKIKWNPDHQSVIAVPYPYLLIAKEYLEKDPHFFVSAQNVYTKHSGAYTGEVSAAMLQSCGVTHVIIGHSERRGYFQESNDMLAEKMDASLAHNLIPIFCCGEALDIREAGAQNDFVEKQIRESLFHLDENQIQKVIVAYEPIWAIGTGKTASSAQAQEMHAYIRFVIAEKFGKEISENISILYGGSVKPSNASEIFSQPDVDGGLVGGASLNADEFEKIINSLKS